MRLGLGAAALLTAVATGCGGHAHDAGTIVFDSDRMGGQVLSYAVRPDGSELRRLDARAWGIWTRDGTKVFALQTFCDNCYVFEPASGTKRPLRLGTVEQVSDMPWSPDGTRLVLGTDEGDVVLEVDTGVRYMLNDRGNAGYLTWSPDGKRLLYADGTDLYTVPADGGPPTRVIHQSRARDPINLEWSADGRWISFMELGAYKSTLYVARSNGSALRRISRNAETATWAPAGEQIAIAERKRIVVVDLDTGTRRRLIEADQAETGGPVWTEADAPVWSPDGKQILFSRNDLGFGAAFSDHTQLWVMNADGSDQRPVTHAFPGDGSTGSPQWIEATLKGRPLPKLALIPLHGARTLVTSLPIVGLGAEGDQAAVAQGFGGIPSFHGPLGPIVLWDAARGTTARVPVPECGSVYDVLMAAGVVGYRCNNGSEAYTVHDALRLGTRELVHTHGEEFSGTFLGGLVADGGSVAFDVGFAGNVERRGGFHIHSTRIWKAAAGRKQLVRTFAGEATVESLDAGRIAVLRGEQKIDILARGGAIRSFTVGRRRIFGAALSGPRLVIFQSGRLMVIDLASGRRRAWPIRRGLGSEPPQLQGAHGGLVAYVAGVAIHILRLSDGREIVIDTPNATGPVFARFVPGGLFYSFNESYASRPGRLVFVTRAELERALGSRAASR